MSLLYTVLIISTIMMDSRICVFALVGGVVVQLVVDVPRVQREERPKDSKGGQALISGGRENV